MTRSTILIVSSPTLARVIEHLFLGRTEFEVTGSVFDLGQLEQGDGVIYPDLILVDVKPVNDGIPGVVAAVKHYSPQSKLILICPMADLSCVARQCGADAFLKAEKLAAHLVPLVRTLSDRPNMAPA